MRLSDANQYSIKLKIVNNSDRELYDQYIHNITGLTNVLFNHLELTEDKKFIKSVMKQFSVDKSLYDYQVKYTKQIYNTNEAAKKRKTNRLTDLENQIDNFEIKTKKDKYLLKKLIKNYQKTLKNKDSNVCFGGKTLLRKITRLSQKSNKSSKEIKALTDIKKEFINERKHPLFLWGKACEGGNRKIDSFLEENYLIFKPSKGVKIKLDVSSSLTKQRKDIIQKLMQLVKANAIPLTYKLYPNCVVVSFDSKLINGFSFDEQEYFKDLNDLKEKHPMADKKVLSKNLYIEKVEELRLKMLEGKVDERVAAIDLNPNNIGFSVQDVISNKVIFTKNYNLNEITDIVKHNGKISRKDNVKNMKYRSNKLRNELCHIYVDIFKHIKHYKVSKFAVEDLDVESGDKGAKGFNRLINNV